MLAHPAVSSYDIINKNAGGTMTDDNSMKVSSFRALPYEKDGRWTVRMEAVIETDKDAEYTVTGEIHGACTTETVRLEKGKQVLSIEVSEENAELWYPKGYGYPHVYPCSMRIGNWTGNAVIGFRKVEWKDGQLCINGTGIYIKAAYWKDSGDTERTVRSAADANINALISENPSEELYRAADHAGIIILGGKEDPSHPSAAGTGIELEHPAVSPSLQSCHLYRSDDERKETEALLSEPGSRRNIILGLGKLFRRPATFDRLVYLTQLKSAFDAIDAVSLRRIRPEETKGAATAILRDDRPISEASLSPDGSWKILHYATRLLYAPLCPLLVIEGTRLRIYAVNDSSREEKIELSVKLRDFHGSKKDAREYSATLQPMEARLFDEIELGRIMRDEYFCYAKLSTKSLLRERNILLDTPSRVKLQDPHIRSVCTKTGPRSISIKLTAEKPAFYVMIDSGNIRGVFSDNLISVRPSAEKNVVFIAEEEADLEKFEREMRIMDLYSAMS